jgi:hypothetical protein
VNDTFIERGEGAVDRSDRVETVTSNGNTNVGAQNGEVGR